MTSFALITEGITDQVVIESILESNYRSVLDEEVEIRILQPLRDATDNARQDGGTFGGWEPVLEHCTLTDRLLEALAFNDFIVIQIDTDSCEHPNFGIPLTNGGVERPVVDLIEAVKAFIIQKIGDEIFSEYGGKFLFAIAVHSTECWLLPLYSKTDAHARKTLACQTHLSRYIGAKGERYAKEYQCYERLVAPLRRTEELRRAMEKCESLRIFVASLPDLSGDDSPEPVQ